MLILVYGLLGFVILVFVHELGHFAVARLFGIQVEEFAIGMGPTLLQKKFRDTTYKICLIPLGGYCAIKGQSDFGTTKRNTDKDSFFGKSPWVRFCVVAAGPLFSFLLGYFLISAAISINGQNRLKYTVLDPPRNSQFFRAGDEVISVNGENIEYWDQIQMALLKNIGSPNTIVVRRNGEIVTVSNYIMDPSEKNIAKSDFFTYYKKGPVIILSSIKDSPAERMGLKFGDVIYSANGTRIRSNQDLDAIVQPSEGPVHLIVHRYEDVQSLGKRDPYFFNNPIYPFTTLKINIVPKTTDGRKALGINITVFDGKDVIEHWIHKDIPFWSSLSLGWTRSWDMLIINAKGFMELLKGNKALLGSLSGPVKIFYEVGKVSQTNGLITFFSFIGTISLALAFFNLLPFPALDGGHMVIAVLEGLFRRPINAKILNTLQMVGVVLLLTLFVFVTIKDISGFF